MIKSDIMMFHITGLDGMPLFLYPFSKKNNLIKLLDFESMSGFYGSEPMVESITYLRNEMYRVVELAVKDWRAEKRFIPRFLISTAVFLVVYFTFSFMIRDPIPMIDEIIAGIIASVVCYFALVKRDYGSRIPTEMRIRLRKKFDEVVFHYDEFVLRSEEVYQYYESLQDTEVVLETLLRSEKNIYIDEEDGEKSRAFADNIRLFFDEKELSKNVRKFLRLKNGKAENGYYKKRIIRWMSKRKINPYMFALYVELTEK